MTLTTDREMGDGDGIQRVEPPIVEIGLGQLAVVALEELGQDRFVGLPGGRQLGKTPKRCGHLRVDEAGFGVFRIVVASMPLGPPDCSPRSC